MASLASSGNIRPQDVIADGENDAAWRMIQTGSNSRLSWGAANQTGSSSIEPVTDTAAVAKASQPERSKTKQRLHSHDGTNKLSGAALSIKQQVEREDRYLIDPRRGRWMTWWDITVMIALLFTAVVTPVEVAFIPPGGACVTPLFAINRMVDIVCLPPRHTVGAIAFPAHAPCLLACVHDCSADSILARIPLFRYS